MLPSGYETALARRRYEVVDPEMRLVARTLERDWEAALGAEQALEAEHAREAGRQPTRLGQAELDAIRCLAEDVPALWQAPTTTAADRQMIARLMLERVCVRVDANSEHVEVACGWAGGVQTRHALIRSVQRFEQLRGFDQLLATIRDLREQGCSAATVAERLNAAGWRPPKRPTFNASMIQHLVFRHRLGTGRPIWSGNVPREPGVEWTLHEAAARLGIHRHTAYRWLQQGRLRGRMAARGNQHIWIVQMTGAELDEIGNGKTQPASLPEHYRNPA